MTQKPDFKTVTQVAIGTMLYSVLPSTKLSVKERIALNSNMISTFYYGMSGDYRIAASRSTNVAELMATSELRKEMEML